MTRTEALLAIRAAREKAGLNQADVATQAGIGQSTWANAEAGKRTISAETIVRMAAAVGLKLRYEPERFTRTR